VITDAAAAAPRSVLGVVRSALQAGAPAIQLRDKSASARELAETARALLDLTRAAEALLFVNDRLDVALAVGADGVHVGPDDLAVGDVRGAVIAATQRGVVSSRFLVGSSTDSPEEAQALVRSGADYIGCGTVYKTSSKPDAGGVIGLEGLQNVVQAVDVPVVGIGGVTSERAQAIAKETGAAGVAVIGAVMAASDPGAAVRELLSPWSATSRPR
jgi:thiamine-phosphate pyrophosphorylase